MVAAGGLSIELQTRIDGSSPVLARASAVRGRASMTGSAALGRRGGAVEIEEAPDSGSAAREGVRRVTTEGDITVILVL